MCASDVIPISTRCDGYVDFFKSHSRRMTSSSITQSTKPTTKNRCEQKRQLLRHTSERSSLLNMPNTNKIPDLCTHKQQHVKTPACATIAATNNHTPAIVIKARYSAFNARSTACCQNPTKKTHAERNFH